MADLSVPLLALLALIVSASPGPFRSLSLVVMLFLVAPYLAFAPYFGLTS